MPVFRCEEIVKQTLQLLELADFNNSQEHNLHKEIRWRKQISVALESVTSY